MARKFLTAIDLAKNELQNARIQNLAGAPSSPVSGQMYYDSGVNKLFWWNGSSWIDATGGAVTFATPTIALGSAAGAGAAGSVIRSDATIAAFDATAPTTSAVGDAAAVGTINFAARRDHTHGREAFGAITAQTSFGAASANGTATSLARSDHTHGTPTHGLTQHQELIATSDLTDWPRTAALDLNGQKLTGIADGVANTDAASVGQMNSAIEGRKWKDTVRAATTAALPALTYAAGAGTLTATANGALGAQDGITLAVGDALLVKNQASTFQNGIYTVTQVGSGAAPFILTRRVDANTAAELSDATVIIEGGTNNQGDIYTQTSTIADLTAAAQTWTKTGEGNAVYTADGSTIILTGNSFSVGNGGITGTQLNASVAGAGLVGGAGSALAVGAGTGVSVAADTVGIDTTVVARKYTALVGNGALTSITVNHALGNQWVTVQVVEVASLAQVECDVVLTDANNATLTFATAPASNAYRVIVVG